MPKRRDALLYIKDAKHAKLKRAHYPSKAWWTQRLNVILKHRSYSTTIYKRVALAMCEQCIFLDQDNVNK